MKKKLFSLLLLPFLFACSSISYQEDPKKEVEKYIEVSTDKISIPLDGTYQLEVTIIEEYTIVFYSSEDENIVTIDDKGLISTVNYGETSVVVRGGKDTYVIPVEVIEQSTVDALQIVLPRDSYNIEVDDVYVLPISTKLGNEVVDATITYEIEDSTVISINNNVIKGLKSGASKVVATATYNDEEVSKGFVINVY